LYDSVKSLKFQQKKRKEKKRKEKKRKEKKKGVNLRLIPFFFSYFAKNDTFFNFGGSTYGTILLLCHNWQPFCKRFSCSFPELP